MNKGDKLGRYKLGEPIGKGAMSEVFASRHPLLERDVAIKVLKKEVCSDQQYVARFLDDARAAHGLNHPNIVRVLDVDDTEAQPFIVMDLVDGQPLDEWQDGPVDLPVATGIARDIASALAAAHAGSLIHRDVKPSNVLIEKRTGAAKLTDFGAAKREREGGQELTQMGQRIGTPRYMAPEQVEGSQVSARTDLFALGALIYELFAGRPAFEGESVSAVYHGILLKQPPPLADVRSEVPAELAELVMKLLSKKPEDRPESAEEVVAALDRISGRTSTLGTTAYPAAGGGTVGAGADATLSGNDETPVPPRPETEPGTPPPPPRATDQGSVGGMGGSKLVPIAAGVVGLLVVLGGSVWLFSGGDEPEQPTEAAGEPVVEPQDEPVMVEEETPADESEEVVVAEEETPATEPELPASEEQAVAEESSPETSPVEEPATGDEPEEPVIAAGGATPEAEPAAEEEPQGQEAADASPEPVATAAVSEQPAEEPPAAEEQQSQTFGESMQQGSEQGAGETSAQDEGGAAGDEADGSQQVAVLPSSDEPAAGASSMQAAELPPLDCSDDEPGCRLTETVVAAIEPAGGQPEITLNKEDGLYLDQEYLVAEVAMPEDLGGYLYLDVYTDQGEVFHLLPEPLREDNELDAGAMIRVGVEEDERATGVRHWQISAPFSTGYLVALVTEDRLFGNLRPLGESIDAYRPALLDALQNAGRVSYSVTPVEFRAR